MLELSNQDLYKINGGGLTGFLIIICGVVLFAGGCTKGCHDEKVKCEGH